jgi:hypothetical protein
VSVTTGGDVKTPVKYFVAVVVAGGGAGATAADMAYPRFVLFKLAHVHGRIWNCERAKPSKGR